MYNMRIGTKTIGVMDVEKYDLSKHIYDGADNKQYGLDDIEFFILSKEEFVKLLEAKEKKEKAKKIEE